MICRVIVLVMLPRASIDSLVLVTTFGSFICLGLPVFGVGAPAWKAAMVPETLDTGFLPVAPYPTVLYFGCSGAGGVGDFLDTAGGTLYAGVVDDSGLG